MNFCSRILEGTVLFTARNKAISWFLVTVLTFGNMFALHVRSCGAECKCSQAIECHCCAKRSQASQSAKGHGSQGHGCCAIRAKAATGKSCCSGRAEATSHPAAISAVFGLAQSFCPAKDLPNSVCNCHHGDSNPQPPPKEQRDDVRVDLAIPALNLDSFPEPSVNSWKLSSIDSFDMGLAQMSHSRRQALLGTWQK